MTNPFKNAAPPEPKRTPQELCDHLNSRRDEVNADRAREGLSPIEWHLHDGRVTVRWSKSSLAMLIEERQRKPVMDRRGQPMSESDTFALNKELEQLGATKRYRSDGSKYDAGSGG